MGGGVEAHLLAPSANDTGVVRLGASTDLSLPSRMAYLSSVRGALIDRRRSKSSSKRFLRT